MDKYVIITKIPTRQGLIGPIYEKITIDETEADGDDAIEKIKEGLHVPLGGFCLIIKEKDITKVTSRIVNEIA